MHALLLLLACASEDPPLSVRADANDGGILVQTSAPVEQVELLREDGVPVLRRALSATDRVTLAVDVAPGAYRVRASSGARSAEVVVAVAAPEPLRVEVQTAPGQPWQRAESRVEVPVPLGGHAEVLIGLTRGPTHPSRIDLRIGEEASEVPLPVHAHREVIPVRLSDAPLRLSAGTTTTTLVPLPYDPAALREQVRVVDARFPTGPRGEADEARPPFAVPLPSDGLEHLVRRLGLGTRRSDPWAPWGTAAVTFENTGTRDVDLVVSLRVRDANGAAAHAFRPRLRAADGDTGTVAALLRVRAGAQATAVLPVHVATDEVSEGAYTLAFDAHPLGSDQTLHTLERALLVTRGDGRVAGGFALTVASGLGALAWSARRLGGWLGDARTADLMTIALFGACLFVAGTAADALALSVALLLGPLGALLTGVFADVARVTLLAALLTLLPRRGTLALALLCGALLRALVFGAFTPADVLYAGVSVAASELMAAGAGLTGSDRWRDEPAARRWLRLSVAFAGASLLTSMAGFSLHRVLYRLYYADWYIGLQLAISGVLYPVIAARMATRIAPTLRAVAP